MENLVFAELMAGGGQALSADQQEFVATHRRILACGNMAGQYLVEMAQSLKAMRDGKLYRAAGFAEFRDYVRTAIGIEERQAYNYIRVAEGLPKDFLAEHAGLGITKLALLAAAEPEDREAAIESGAADESVRALQEKIRELEAERDRQAVQLSMFEAESKEAREDAHYARGKLEAEKRKSLEEVERARKKLEAAEKKIGKLTEEKARAEKEAADLKNLPPKVEKVEDPQTVAKLKEAEAERDSALAALETAKKQLEIAADDNMARFRILFEDFQVLLDKMLGVAFKMSDENRIKCVGALRSVMQGKGL